MLPQTAARCTGGTRASAHPIDPHRPELPNNPAILSDIVPCYSGLMRIDSLSRYPKRERGQYFNDLPPSIRRDAEERLSKFRGRWALDLPNWRLAILVGQARRLALHPPDSAWGRSMLAARGGHAVQRRRREEKLYQGDKAAFGAAVQSSSRNAVPASLNSKGKRQRRRQAPPLAPVPPDSARPLIDTPPPSPQVHRLHMLTDPPGCRCYYCAWPHHEN
jgi:hypothetical protein